MSYRPKPGDLFRGPDGIAHRLGVNGRCHCNRGVVDGTVFLGRGPLREFGDACPRCLELDADPDSSGRKCGECGWFDSDLGCECQPPAWAGDNGDGASVLAHESAVLCPQFEKRRKRKR